MTLHQLKIFAAVAKHLNVTKASKELHISQPSVSQQLKLLEEEGGVKLYKNTGRGVELTEKGRLFLSDAESILFRVERLKEKFSTGLNDERVGFLTIGGSHSQSVFFLPQLMAVFKKTHPQIQISLRTDFSCVIERLALDSKVEIAVITNPSYSPFLTYEPYRQGRVVTFASVKHALAKKELLTLADLAQAPLIIRAGRVREMSRVEELLLKLGKRQGFKPNIVMRCESPIAIKNAVKTGLGLGILYEGDAMGPDIKGGELTTLKVPQLRIHFTRFIIYHKEKPLSSPAQEFLALLRHSPRRTRANAV